MDVLRNKRKYNLADPAKMNPKIEVQEAKKSTRKFPQKMSRISTWRRIQYLKSKQIHIQILKYITKRESLYKLAGRKENLS